jgi:hypothetical protein
VRENSRSGGKFPGADGAPCGRGHGCDHRLQLGNLSRGQLELALARPAATHILDVLVVERQAFEICQFR